MDLPLRVRLLARIARGPHLRAYYRGLRQGGLPADRERVRRWRMVLAAARFEDRRPAREQAKMLEILRRSGVEL